MFDATPQEIKSEGSDPDISQPVSYLIIVVLNFGFFQNQLKITKYVLYNNYRRFSIIPAIPKIIEG